MSSMCSIKIEKNIILDLYLLTVSQVNNFHLLPFRCAILIYTQTHFFVYSKG